MKIFNYLNLVGKEITTKEMKKIINIEYLKME